MTNQPPSRHAETTAEKQRLRRLLARQRSEVNALERGRSDAQRTALVLALFDEVTSSGDARSGPSRPANDDAPVRPTAAVYLSRDGEPGTSGLVDALRERGVGLLVPAPGPTSWREPAWSWLGQTTDAGPAGIPVTASPRLPAASLAQADIVIMAGLAGAIDGTRLGTGGGWYDQALVFAPQARRWLLLNDQEVFDHLPHLSHDLPVDVIITPTRVITCHGA